MGRGHGDPALHDVQDIAISAPGTVTTQRPLARVALCQYCHDRAAGRPIAANHLRSFTVASRAFAEPA